MQVEAMGALDRKRRSLAAATRAKTPAGAGNATAGSPATAAPIEHPEVDS
jgi:hypothetical protein